MTTARDLSLDLPAGADRDAAVEQEALFDTVPAEFAAPLARLARAHEADPSLRQDLLQEIHLALWRSLASFGKGFFVFSFLTSIYCAIFWLRQGKPKPLIPVDAGALDSLRFFRREVERRISNLSRFGFLGALVGPLVGVIVGLLSLEHRWGSHGVWVYLAVKFGILFPALMLYLMHRRKRFLRRELAALDALRG